MAFAAFCAAAEVVMRYQTYARVLKWLTLALLSYVDHLVPGRRPVDARRPGPRDAAGRMGRRDADDDRRDPRHDDQPLSLLLAGEPGSRGSRRQSRRAAAEMRSDGRACRTEADRLGHDDRHGRVQPGRAGDHPDDGGDAQCQWDHRYPHLRRRGRGAQALRRRLCGDRLRSGDRRHRPAGRPRPCRLGRLRRRRGPPLAGRARSQAEARQGLLRNDRRRDRDRRADELHANRSDPCADRRGDDQRHRLGAGDGGDDAGFDPAAR